MATPLSRSRLPANIFRRFLVPLLAAVGLVSAGPAHASAPQDYYGLSVQTLFNVVPSSSWPAYLQPMTDGGLTIGRVTANWASAEPNPPDVSGHHNYTWASMDRLAGVLAAQGIRMYDVLSMPPRWARSPSLAAHYGDLAAFGAAFAGRYGTGGTFWAEHPELPYLPELDFEFWTEANSTHFWEGSPNAAEYMKAFRLVSDAIHQAVPTARVMASIGWQDFARFTAELYANGARGVIDGIAFHPYSPIATGIVALVQQLRWALNVLGDPNLPINVTEIGQVVTYSGPGSRRAGEGNVTDAARAATQSFAGDALAHGDCGVQGYLVYTIVGTETGTEPIGEGFMGVLNVATGTPNATGAALMAASSRWRAQPQGGLVLCHPGVTPRRSLLPLGLRIEHVSPSCAVGITTYHGSPLESAQLTLRTRGVRSSHYDSDSTGYGRVCVPGGPPVHSFRVHAEIANMAHSATYRCDVLGSCWRIRPLARWGLTARIVRAGGVYPEIRARLNCAPTVRPGMLPRTSRRCQRSLRATVLVRRRHPATGRGVSAWRTLRHVNLRVGRRVRFHVLTRLAHRDRVVVRIAPRPRRGIPRLRAAPRTSLRALALTTQR